MPSDNAITDPTPTPRRVRPWAAIVPLVAMTLAVVAALAARPWAVSGPHLHIHPCAAIELGEGPPGVTLRHTYRIASVGSEPVEYRVVSGCGCLVITPAAGTLKPGEAVNLQLSLKLTQRGKTESGSFRIESNDPDQPSVLRYAKGTCPAALETDVTSIDFGRLMRGSVMPTKTLTVRSALVPLDDYQITGDDTIVEISTPPGRRPPFAVEVRPKADLPDGTYTTGVHFVHANDAELCFHVPVRFEVCDRIFCVPSWIEPSAVADAGREVRLIVRRSDGEPLGPIQSHGGAPWFEVRNSTSGVTASRRVIVISRRTGPAETPLPKSLTVVFAGDDAAIEVPIRGSE